MHFQTEGVTQYRSISSDTEVNLARQVTKSYYTEWVGGYLHGKMTSRGKQCLFVWLCPRRPARLLPQHVEILLTESDQLYNRLGAFACQGEREGLEIKFSGAK